VTRLISHRLMVRFRDCDPLGHVNNAVYLTYLEQARFTLWRQQIGFVARPVSDGGKRGEGMILARAEIDFRAQARYGDELEVQLSIASIGRSSFTYEYQIVRLPAGDVMASARTVQVWFDYDRERPVPLSDEMKRQLAAPIGG
jgi:acyl-CoA thioester hydrolase